MSYNPYQDSTLRNTQHFHQQHPQQPLYQPQSSPFFVSSPSSSTTSLGGGGASGGLAGGFQGGMEQQQQQQQQPFLSMLAQGQALMANPTANLVFQQGVSAAETYMEKNLSRYVTINKLKYYFAVDTSYVLQKLKVVLFPFLKRDWDRGFVKDPSTNSIVFSPPRQDINAPDLYIPMMAFVTYLLVVGFLLGLSNEFNVERLGVTASSALVWLFVEVVVMSLSLYVLNINSPIQTIDLIAYCGYKYVGMILTSLSLLIWRSSSLYYLLFAFTNTSLGYFLMRTLRVAMIEEANVSEGNYHVNRKRYFLLSIVASQVLLSYYLTHF